MTNSLYLVKRASDLAVCPQQHLFLPVKVQVDDQGAEHGVVLVTFCQAHRPRQAVLLHVSEEDTHGQTHDSEAAAPTGQTLSHL